MRDSIWVLVWVMGCGGAALPAAEPAVAEPEVVAPMLAAKDTAEAAAVPPDPAPLAVQWPEWPAPVVLRNHEGREIRFAPRCWPIASGREVLPDGTSRFNPLCRTPLVLSLDDRPVQVLPDDGRSVFDLSAAQDATGTRVDWPSAATPWLALDRDGDGRITSGRELFGSATELPGGITAAHGFAALAELDDDRDGDVDADDPAFASLLAWSDVDGDRRSDDGELRALDDLGVIALDLAYVRAPRCDERGNCEIERAAVQLRGGGEGALVDLHLAPR